MQSDDNLEANLTASHVSVPRPSRLETLTDPVCSSKPLQ